MYFDPDRYTQHEYELRCEWGLHGVHTLAPFSDVVIIVDVLSFSTSVSVAVERGAVVYPYAGPRDELPAFAESVDAEIADKRGSGTRYSLSPSSLAAVPAGMRLVLPSPNGSTLSLQTGSTATFAGCLRNARAVAQAAMQAGTRIAVIPAGERWRADGSLRPSFEDLVGAGAILSYLRGSLSPEATSAVSAYERAANQLEEMLFACGSGRELIDGGSRSDVRLAAELNLGQCAPRLVSGAYRNAP